MRTETPNEKETTMSTQVLRPATRALLEEHHCIRCRRRIPLGEEALATDEILARLQARAATDEAAGLILSAIHVDGLGPVERRLRSNCGR